ncbi:hypothetical protein BDV98DRAFT_480386, partial [Pterulicium gracile]
LDVVNDDVLLHVFRFLHVPDVVAIRQTCKRLSVLSRVRLLWQTIVQEQIVSRGLPFINTIARPLSKMRQPELEARARRAYRLSLAWSTLSSTSSTSSLSQSYSPSSNVFDIRFLPGHDGRRFMTVSGGIWFHVSIWEINSGEGGDSSESGGGQAARKLVEWGPKGLVISALVLNDVEGTEATMAVSTNRDECVSFLLCLQSSEISCLRAASHQPMLLHGDLLVTSNDFSTTVIWNWKTGAHVTLQQPADDAGLWHDRCVQVLLTHQSVLVVRARSIHLFPLPSFLVASPAPISGVEPIISHSFGWINSIHVQVSVCGEQSSDDEHESGGGRKGDWPALTILCREEGADFWSAQAHQIQMYVLEPNPAFVSESTSTDSSTSSTSHTESPAANIPYLFPPLLTARASSKKGYSRCSQVILGQRGTAVWIQPRERSGMGLVGMAGGMTMGDGDGMGDDVAQVKGRPLWTNGKNDWTSVDYDEVNGRIALGTSGGRVVVMGI